MPDLSSEQHTARSHLSAVRAAILPGGWPLGVPDQYFVHHGKISPPKG